MRGIAGSKILPCLLVLPRTNNSHFTARLLYVQHKNLKSIAPSIETINRHFEACKCKTHVNSGR